MQQLVFAVPGLANKLTDLNTYLGIVKPLQFPYNLFINLSQLVSPDDRLIYLFAYQLGAKRVVLWGVYDKVTSKFSFDGACRYSVSELIRLVNTWKSEGQHYVANSVVDRFTGKIKNYLDLPYRSYSDYLRDKFILGYFNGKISSEELEQRYPNGYSEFLEKFEKETGLSPISDDYDFILQDYLQDLREELSEYEETINRLDLVPSLAGPIRKVVAQITDRFYESIKNGHWETESFYSSLRTCPSLQQCQRDVTSPDCSVFFYGNRNFGLFNENDPHLLI